MDSPIEGRKQSPVVTRMRRAGPRLRGEDAGRWQAETGEHSWGFTPYDCAVGLRRILGVEVGQLHLAVRRFENGGRGVSRLVYRRFARWMSTCGAVLMLGTTDNNTDSLLVVANALSDVVLCGLCVAARCHFWRRWLG
jgi:hypothetical protein